jgi:hypothetical protein
LEAVLAVPLWTRFLQRQHGIEFVPCRFRLVEPVLLERVVDKAVYVLLSALS